MTETHHGGDFEQGVMVDIGPGAGALVIYTGAALLGSEIEIALRGEEIHRSHTDVLKRKISSGDVYAAVFGSLPEGDYRIWHSAIPEPVDVHVASNHITELDWR